MSGKLIIAPEAGQDTAEAYVWYENRRRGLGEEFLSCLDACLEAIRRSPEMYPFVFETYRRGLIRRFPFLVFYEHENEIITIYAIFPASPDPKKWRQRLL